MSRLFREQREIDTGSHCLVTGVVGVNVVAGVEVWVQVRGFRWVSCDAVEVDNAIECAAGADPVVHGFAHLFVIL